MSDIDNLKTFCSLVLKLLKDTVTLPLKNPSL